MTEPLIPSTRKSPQVRNGRPAEDLHITDLHLPNDDVAAVSDPESPPGVPRWVKASGIVAIVLLLVFVGLHLTGHSGGPGMHDMPVHGVMLP